MTFPVFDLSLTLAATASAQPSLEIVVVFGIIAGALLLFVSEWIPIDMTALAVIVALVVLEPWTMVGPREAISGFANPATITVMAMFVLSEGVRRTGLIQWLGDKIVDIAGGNPIKQFMLLTGFSGSTAGMINNTPVVAMMIPMVNNITEKTGTSPSTYLMPISFISMIGGMLTLIGTSSNLLASDISDRLLDRPFTMFEFTQLGLVLLVIGFVYLLFIGRHLVPKRIKPGDELTEEFEMENYLTQVCVGDDSPLVGSTVREALDRLDIDGDIIHLIRDEAKFSKPLARKEVCAGDLLMIRTDRDNLFVLLESEALEIVPATGLLQSSDDDPQRVERRLVEVVIQPDSDIAGRTLESLNFEERYEAAVFAIRRGRQVLHDRMGDIRLRGGDSLLVLASSESFEDLSTDRRFIVVDEQKRPGMRTAKIPIAVAIVLAVIAVAGAGILPIVVTSLAGVLAMVVTGCLQSREVYESVDWSVIFLLAGMIPLGTALEETGGAAYLADFIVGFGDILPGLAMLFVFYLFTTLITQVVSNNASVVLMIPVAIQAADSIGAEPFSFVLAVTFAASTAMLTPIGYQTNLMVYAPGNYRFTDFFRVGAPLQLLLALGTTFGIWLFWGV